MENPDAFQRRGTNGRTEQPRSKHPTVISIYRCGPHDEAILLGPFPVCRLAALADFQDNGTLILGL